MKPATPTTFWHRRIALNDPQPEGETVCVTDDGVDDLYHVKRHERAAFRSWAGFVFCRGMNSKRLTGAWPSYTVKQPS